MDRTRVLVTAGASGIGHALARAFRADGARVAVCDIDSAAVASVPEEILAMTADVTDEAAMGAVFHRLDSDWGGIDVLCANAGTGGPAGPVETLDLAGWRACLSANLDGAFLACRWAAAHMKAQGSGLILLTSSTSGLMGCPNRSPYVTAKWGVIGLMKTLAMELGPHGVRVNALCPGAVEGDRMERVLEMEARARRTTTDAVRQIYLQGTSLRSWITADDVAAMALFLASPAGAKISGQALAIDGHTETLNG
jgi:NAD(P)-dependent dehydrogenase (short-subunit alcohol dehydrogenase family)